MSEQQKRAKGLAVEYKMSLMSDLQTDAQELDQKGRKAVEDMTRVRLNIQSTESYGSLFVLHVQTYNFQLKHC